MRSYYPDDHIAAQRFRRGRAVLTGYGMDNADGHVRYTRTNAVCLYGGSEAVHGEMQRRAQSIQEELDKHGISLDNMTYEQFKIARTIVERANNTQNSD